MSHSAFHVSGNILRTAAGLVIELDGAVEDYLDIDKLAAKALEAIMTCDAPAEWR